MMGVHVIEKYYEVTFNDGSKCVLEARHHRQAAAVASQRHHRLTVTKVRAL